MTAVADWTFEEAWAAQEAYIAGGGANHDPASPFAQWAALQRIDDLRVAYEKGDTFALLDAVAQCAMRDLVMPEWVWRAYLDRYRRVVHFKVATLDEAFGRCLPKGAKLAARRQAHEKGILAYSEVRRRHDESGESIGVDLFERVGKDLGIGASKIRDYYTYWRRKLLTAGAPQRYKKTPE